MSINHFHWSFLRDLLNNGTFPRYRRFFFVKMILNNLIMSSPCSSQLFRYLQILCRQYLVIFPLRWTILQALLRSRFSRDRGENYVIFGSHIGVGDNSVSNQSKPYDKDNILHCMFNLEKILKMPRSCCVKNCSIYGW